MRYKWSVGLVSLVTVVLAIVSVGFAQSDFKGVEISAITWDTATARAIEALIPEFEAEYGIKVNWEVYSEPVLREKVIADLAARTGAYDIFLLDGWQTARYVRAGYVVPLDDLLANQKSEYYCEDFAPIYLDALKYDGKLWGLPYYGHVGILMYRQDVFEEMGIAVPETTAQMTDVAAKVTDKANNFFGIAMRAIRGEDNPIISTSWTWVHGGEWLDEENKPGVTSPEFIAGVEWFSDILKNYGPPDVSRYSWLEVQNIFVTGQCAMIFDASDFVGRIEDPNLSQIVGDVGYALAPAGPYGPVTERYASHLFTAGMAINADSTNIDAAWLFLQWMTSKEIQVRTMIEGNNTGITSVSAMASEEFMNAFPGVPVILEALTLANPEYMPRIPEFPELCEIIGTQISRTVTGEVSVEDAMKLAYDEMYSVLERAGYYR
ncbi:MAG TPA: sugar ABC transporter substrate-binding protein [Atribacteraceae bacterium]|nr:sugar ABC transporter substrate-binding protein [Atribacteraceae bacterium]